MNTALKAVYLALGVALLALVCLLGYIGVKYIIPVAQNVSVASESLPQTMNSVKESADTANLVSTESLDLVGNANKLIDGLVVTNGKAGRLIDSGTATVARLGGVADATTTRINALATAQAKAELVMDQIATIPAHVNTALDGVTGVSHSAQLFISDPVIKEMFANLSLAAANGAKLESSLNLSVQHIDHRWLAPWDGTHKFKHYAGATFNTGLQLTGIGATLVRDTK